MGSSSPSTTPGQPIQAPRDAAATARRRHQTARGAFPGDGPVGRSLHVDGQAVATTTKSGISGGDGPPSPDVIHTPRALRADNTEHREEHGTRPRRWRMRRRRAGLTRGAVGQGSTSSMSAVSDFAGMGPTLGETGFPRCRPAVRGLLDRVDSGRTAGAPRTRQAVDSPVTGAGVAVDVGHQFRSDPSPWWR